MEDYEVVAEEVEVWGLRPSAVVKPMGEAMHQRIRFFLSWLMSVVSTSATCCVHASVGFRSDNTPTGPLFWTAALLAQQSSFV